MDVLKQCPVCGGKAVIEEHEAYSIDSSFDYIMCEDCNVSMMGWPISRAKESWNNLKRIEQKEPTK